MAGLDQIDRARLRIALDHARHRNRRQHRCARAERLQHVAKRKRVHHRRQHAHVIAGDPIQSRARECGASKQVAAAQHDAELRTRRLRGDDLAPDSANDFGIDAEVGLAGQCFTAELEQIAGDDRSGHEALALTSDLRRHFRRKVGFDLVDTFTDFVPDEAGTTGVLLRQQLADARRSDL